MPKQTPVLSYEELEATLTTDNPYYQTPVEMTLKAINARLTGAEWSLWGYLQALDPHGDRLKQLPPVSDLAKAVGISDRQCHRALNRLKDLGLYYWEPVIIRGQNLAGKRVKEIREEKNKKFSGEDKLTTLSSPRQSCPSDDKVVFMETKLSLPGQSCLSQAPEPLPQADSKTSQTSSDYSDFIQTLSEGERENFEEFGRKQAANLPKPPTLINKWIAANFTELYKQFKAAPKKEDKRLTPSERRKIFQDLRDKDWRSDPRHNEWLSQARQKGHDWYLDPEDKISEAEAIEKSIFYDWCEDTKAFAPFQGIP